MKPRFSWRHQYDADRDEKEGLAAAIHCDDESLTQQQFTEDADLNVIAKRFGLTAKQIPPMTPDARLYGDVSEAPDLRTILEAQRAARESFASLPPKILKRFHNNINELWEFLQDPENIPEAIALGILKKKDTEVVSHQKEQDPAPKPATRSDTGDTPKPPEKKP